MFSNSYQSGFVSIFYSVGSNPLALWDKQVKNGHIRRVIDEEIKSLVLEISGTNVATTYVTCPIKPRASLGIKLPFFVMIIKNMNKYFTFEIQILDDKEMHRRFRVSNFQSTTKVRPFCTTMPIGLSSGWNQVQFNLADFTKRAYGTTYMETMRVQIHANTRIRRLYFTDTLYTEEDLPNEFKLFGPASTQKKKQVETKPSKEQVVKEQAHPVTPKTAQDKAEEEIPPPPTPIDVEVAQETEKSSEEKPPDATIKEDAPEGKHVGEISVEEETKVPDEVKEGVTAEEGTAADGGAVEEAAAGIESAGDLKAVESAAANEIPTGSHEEAPKEHSEEQPTEEHTEAPAAEEVEQTPAPATEHETVSEELPKTEETGVVEEISTTEPATTEEPTTTEAPTDSENESPEE